MLQDYRGRPTPGWRAPGKEGRTPSSVEFAHHEGKHVRPFAQIVEIGPLLWNMTASGSARNEHHPDIRDLGDEHHGFGSVTKYGIYSVSRSYWTGGGSTSYTEGHGNLLSSASGYITTPTYYSDKDSNRETVSVKVVIGGVSGTDAANCD